MFNIGVFLKKEKQHSQNLSYFENESTFWKKKHILQMKANSETHFENENIFSGKWKVITNQNEKYKSNLEIVHSII